MMGSTPDTELSLCTTWMAADLAKVQPRTRMQEFGMANVPDTAAASFPTSQHDCLPHNLY